MSYLVTYYPNRDVIAKLRSYRKCMERYVSDSKLAPGAERDAETAFDALIEALKNDIKVNRYASIFDVKALSALGEQQIFDHFLKQEINIVAQTLDGSNDRSEAIVYRTLSYFGENDNIHRITDIISVISVTHRSNMASVQESRRKQAAEKERIKRKIRASVEYITAGTAVLIVNNTLGVGPLQIPSSTLGAGAILRGIADIRGV